MRINELEERGELVLSLRRLVECGLMECARFVLFCIAVAITCFCSALFSFIYYVIVSLSSIAVALFARGINFTALFLQRISQFSTRFCC